MPLLVHTIAVVIMWSMFAIYMIYKILFNFVIFRETAKIVIGKDVAKEIRYKYLLTFYFDNPSNNFDMKNTRMFFELITKDITRIANFSIKSSELTDRRANILLHRKRTLRPITKIRAMHDCEDNRIYLKAIRVHDYRFGHLIYYGIEKYLYYSPMIEATIHCVVTPSVRLFAEQTFSPNFIQLRTDSFGIQKITSSTDKTHDMKAVLLIAGIGWFEDTMFVLYFMVSLFFFNVLFVVILSAIIDFGANWRTPTIVSVVLSSWLSFYSTNVSALFYRRVIKTNYNIYCSPQLMESDKDSHLWILFKNLSLTYLLFVSIAISVFIPFLIEQYTTPEESYHLSQMLGIHINANPFLNELLFLVSYFLSSLTTSIVLWLLISGLFRYIYYKFIFKPKDVDFETLIQHIDETRPEETIQLPVRDALKEETLSKSKTKTDSKIESKTESKVDSKVESKVKSKTNPKSEPKTDKKFSNNYPLGTKRLEKELQVDLKDKRLKTGSIITKPTNAAAFVDPEKFRIDSKPKGIAKTNDSHKK